ESINVTGMPMLAKDMAMPPPIVPAPMTATVRMGRNGVLAGMSGILAASAAADLAWARARSRSASLTVKRSVVLSVVLMGVRPGCPAVSWLCRGQIRAAALGPLWGGGAPR